MRWTDAGGLHRVDDRRGGLARHDHGQEVGLDRGLPRPGGLGVDPQT